MQQIDFEPGVVIAIAFITGFAIQQLLQILDLIITPLINRNDQPILFMPRADFKKSLMHILSFLCGLIITLSLPIKLLSYAGVKDTGGMVDTIITAFVLGSGTEAANTLIKYFGYLKDAQKYEVKPQLEVIINPSTAIVKTNGTIDFKTVVKNSSNQAYLWGCV